LVERSRSIERAERGAGAAAVIALSLAWGLAWLALEGLLAALSEAGPDRTEALRRTLRFLPWQLLVFAGAAAVALVLRRGGRGRRDDGDRWLFPVTASASLVFLLAPVAWGLARAVPIPRLALSLLALVTAVAGLFAAASLVARLLPPRLAGAFALGTCSAWALVFVPTLRRIAPSMALTVPHLADLPGFLRMPELGVAAGVGALLLVVGLLVPRAGRRGLLVAAGPALLLTAFLVPRAELPAREPGPPELPDVIVILVDTMRADLLQGTGAPALQALARESVRFEQAIAPSNRTRSSLPAIMTGLSFQVTGPALPEAAVTLAERLAAAGYATIGFSANPIVSEQFGYGQGFEQLIDPGRLPEFLSGNVLRVAGTAAPGLAYRLGIVDADLYYRPIGELRRRASRAFAARRRPTFLYVQTMDLHGPYLPPPRYLPVDYRPDSFLSYFEFLRLSGRGVLAERPDELRNLRERYEGELRYTDAELGDWLQALRAEGRFDESLIWVLSDHGEDFGEHDHAGHGGEGLWTSLVHVPLLVKPPRSWGIAPRSVPEAVSVRDLLPTTLSLLGLPPLSQSFGRDLSERIRGGPASGAPVISETATTQGVTYAATRLPFRLVLSFRRDGSEARALHHLERDPGETVDVQAEFPDVARALDAAVRERRQLEHTFRFAEETREVDPQTRERLRSLGYVD
jgi:arylsulfatase A-like enzyme